MGYRTDQAYEDAQRADYRAWRASLSRKEYAAHLWRSWSPFVFGLVTGAIMFAAILVVR